MKVRKSVEEIPTTNPVPEIAETLCALMLLLNIVSGANIYQIHNMYESIIMLKAYNRIEKLVNYWRMALCHAIGISSFTVQQHR